MELTVSKLEMVPTRQLLMNMSVTYVVMQNARKPTLWPKLGVHVEVQLQL